MSLSGGQKMRVSLARALYRNADVYLMDDIFAAVDIHVAKHIFQHVIRTYLKGKTVLMVTHHHFVLPTVDKILYMVNGRIEAQGTYGELLNLGVPLEDIESQPNSPVTTPSSSLHASLEDVKEDGEEDENAGKAVQDEEREYGSVKWSVLRAYFAHFGWVWLILGAIASLAAELLLTAKDYWYGIIPNSMTDFRLTAWSSKMEREEETYSLGVALGVYGALALSSPVIHGFVQLIILRGTLIASKLYHSTLLGAMLRAPVQFFDTTPVGRILNRFSKDQESLDTELGPASKFQIHRNRSPQFTTHWLV